MENRKKFFFSKEDNALDLFVKLDRNQMKMIVGAYTEARQPTYSESTATKKPKVDPNLPKGYEEMQFLPKISIEDELGI